MLGYVIEKEKELKNKIMEAKDFSNFLRFSGFNRDRSRYIRESWCSKFVSLFLDKKHIPIYFFQTHSNFDDKDLFFSILYSEIKELNRILNQFELFFIFQTSFISVWFDNEEKIILPITKLSDKEFILDGALCKGVGEADEKIKELIEKGMGRCVDFQVEGVQYVIRDEINLTDLKSGVCEAMPTIVDAYVALIKLIRDKVNLNGITKKK